jgi:hypothetical protein
MFQHRIVGAILISVLSICFAVGQIKPTIPGPSADYVRAGQLRWLTADALRRLGDRLERAGKERMTMTGTLTVAGQPAPIPFRMFWELPGRLRLESQISTGTKIVLFDGARLSGTVTRQDEDFVEGLFYDSAEHFFVGQMQGLATRFLGSRFRPYDAQGSSYAGPYYDIYEVSDSVAIGARKQPKLYYFNSNTLLLERVRYQHNRDQSRTNVEIQIANWQTLQGQSAPAQIVRFENGQPVLIVTIASVLISAKQNDGLFVVP